MKHLLQLLFIVLLTVSGFAPEAARAQSGPGKKAEVQAAEGYVLTGAYPNPFALSTAFSLTVRQRQNVKVQVFNMLGQPVKELFDGVMNAGETREFRLDAGSLPSGIYIYRVQGQTFVASRQATLLK